MRADQYLVRHGYFDTRARAQAAIAAGCVRVDGQIIDKPSRTIPDGARVEAQAAHPYVSRAALKLAAGLDAFAIDPAERVCLDVGASTGASVRCCWRVARVMSLRWMWATISFTRA